MRRFTGISASKGLVMGPVHRLHHGTAGLVRVVGLPVREQALFDAAVILAKEELYVLEEKTDGTQQAILMFQRMMLEDAGLLAQVAQRIADGDGAAAAMEWVGRHYAATLENLDDEYMSQRSVDVLDVCRRVVNILDGEPRKAPELEVPCILVGERIFPSDIISIDRAKILGFATSGGSIQSHAAIMARTMDIPAVVQLGSEMLTYSEGHAAILDAYNGDMIVQPDADAVRHAQRRIVGEGMLKKRMAFLKDQPCITKDGTAVTLLANCSSPTDIRAAMDAGADGVGLLRSEFVITGEHIPGEDEQYYYYMTCLEAAAGHPVTICTFDIGADKRVEGLEDTTNYSPLGMRGVRLQLSHPELFVTQMRALLRTALKGDLRIMFPMITGPADWKEALELVEVAKSQLRREGVPFNEKVPIGAMIEVPSAALLADEILADRCSFVHVGTNDLTQYTYAADRRDSRMSGYFTGWPHAVGRLIDMVVAAAWSQELPVTICGVSATDPDTAERFIRQGVRGLCMEARSLMQIKAHLLELDLNEPPRFQR